MYYTFVRNLCAVFAHFFFKEVEVNGRENIPTDAGYILALNHPNSFIDAVLCSGSNSLGLHFLTRSDAFVPPWDTVLQTLHLMPVYRLRDGIKKLAKNDETFDKCYELFRNGSGVLIFSEANTAKQYFLRPISKGTARLAINAQLNNPKPMYILPAGISYVEYDESGHKVFINYGKPIDITAYLDDYAEKPPVTLNKLKAHVSNSISELLTVQSQDESYERKVSIIRQYGDMCNYDELKALLNDYERVTIKPEDASTSMMHTLLSIPHWPVFALIKRVLSDFKDPQFILSVKFLVGMVSLPVYWLIIFCLLYFFAGFWIAASVTGLFVLSLLVRAQFK